MRKRRHFAIPSLQCFFIVPFTYICKGTIFPEKKPYPLCNVQHYLNELFHDGYQAEFPVSDLVMFITHAILTIVPLTYHIIKLFGSPKKKKIERLS